MINILAAGDSNTFGFDPTDYASRRFSKDIRWTGIINNTGEFCVENFGNNGACIPASDIYIQNILNAASKYNIDIITFMFGSNDLLGMSLPDAAIVSEKMELFLGKLLQEDNSVADKILLISPPPMRLGEWTNENIVNASKHFSSCYKLIADKLQLKYMDANSLQLTLCFDGVHFTAEDHKLFAEEILKHLTKQA